MNHASFLTKCSPTRKDPSIHLPTPSSNQGRARVSQFRVSCEIKHLPLQHGLKILTKSLSIHIASIPFLSIHRKFNPIQSKSQNHPTPMIQSCSLLCTATKKRGKKIKIVFISSASAACSSYKWLQKRGKEICVPKKSKKFVGENVEGKIPGPQKVRGCRRVVNLERGKVET